NVTSSARMWTAVEAAHPASMTQLQQPWAITRSALSMTIASGYVPGSTRRVSRGLAALMASWNGVPGPGETTIVVARPGVAVTSVTRLTPRAAARMSMATSCAGYVGMRTKLAYTSATQARLDVISRPVVLRSAGRHPAHPSWDGRLRYPHRHGPAAR